jgi:tryptophan-rich sensory protein
VSTGRISKTLVPTLVAAAAAALVATLGALSTDLGPWYQDLAKPWFQPPGWLFGPAWTLIYALTAAAAVTAWLNVASRPTRRFIVGLFSVNMLLNWAWSFIFFALRRPDLALLEVAFLWASIAALVVALWSIARRAALLLVPYLLWVTFASLLNYAVVALNPGLSRFFHQ